MKKQKSIVWLATEIPPSIHADESHTFGPRGVDGDSWLAGMAIAATCGTRGTRSRGLLSRGFYTTNTAFMDWTGSDGRHGVLAFR